MQAKQKYSLGIDFGSLSARSVLVDVANGKEIAVATKEYTHGFIENYVPNTNIKLPANWTLQHPKDYLEALGQIVKQVINKANVDPANIIGVGIDFTSCTMLPIKGDGTPLCFLENFKNNKHAYVKLWKHHAPQNLTDTINEVANENGEDFINRYGGKISSEWLLPKIWQILDQAPEIYNAADKFIEAGDWIVMILTGYDVRSSSTAGYKGLWSKNQGFPSKSFFAKLDPKLENLVEDKFSEKIQPLGTKAGEITKKAHELTGLKVGTPVAVGNIDAHVTAPACGISKEDQLLMIIGTSTCHLFINKEEIFIPGISGVVEDGILPGYFGYEAGQACVGDLFNWFVKNFVPCEYINTAKSKNISIHEYLRNKSLSKGTTPSGLVALDWWNGNRSVLEDARLSGMILGMNLSTKAEDIYKALLEATAFGTRKIIETVESNGISFKEIIACGGIARKDPFMMQIYADVTNKEIKISDSIETGALGAAMYGSVAAGLKAGGYESIFEASKKMSKLKDITYKPNPDNAKLYDKIYLEYCTLHDYFGKGGNDVMKRLLK